MTRRANATDYRGQRVLLVGLGLHGGGVATARWLLNQGANLRVTDTKTAAELASSISQLPKKGIVFHLGGYRSGDWTWAQRIVVNPAVSPQLPQLRAAEKRRIPVANEASIFVEKFSGTSIGVTGTRGKTTTTLLLGAILKRAHRDTIISGNVRQVPMLAYLPKSAATTWAVVELSSYQLERLPVPNHPLHVAVMTNLKVDHVNRHGSLFSYAQTKYNIFRGQTLHDWKILQWHDPVCRQAAAVGLGQVYWFGHRLPSSVNGVTLRNGWVIEQAGGRRKKLFPLSIWKMPGQHNLENLLAATAAARVMIVSPSVIRRAVAVFPGVPYRQQLIRTFRGHQCINDTAATSPDATLAALNVYPRGVYIVGGTDKALDMKPLARELVRRNVPTVFLPGTATVKLHKDLRNMNYRQPIVTVHSMHSAVQTALVLAQAGQPIVLSPGAASFGLFIHEFDRGDQFSAIVNKLS